MPCPYIPLNSRLRRISTFAPPPLLCQPGRAYKDLGQRLGATGPLDLPTVKKRSEGVLSFSGRSMRRPPGEARERAAPRWSPRRYGSVATGSSRTGSAEEQLSSGLSGPW